MYNVSFNGKLFSLRNKIVMGIINVTPDSFYVSDGLDKDNIVHSVRSHLVAGATIIDIGGCSTRPNAEYATQDEEYERVDYALHVIRNNFPDINLSIDTFRSKVAAMAVEKYRVDMINDISGGRFDENMFDTAGKLGVPYVLTHNDTPDDSENINFIAEMIDFFQKDIYKLKKCGVKDIILDPGIGFGKTLNQNYLILHHLQDFKILGYPILVGVSHKSMISRTLNVKIDDERCENGTTVLETLALNNGADIIRTHNVIHTIDTIKLLKQTYTL